MDLIINHYYHPACGLLRIFLISPRFTPYEFLSRCKFSNLTARQPMVEFSLLHVPTLSVTEATTQILDLLMEPTGRGGLATLQQGGIGDLTR